MKTNRSTDFGECVEEYLYDCRSRQLRPKTMQSYEQTLRLFERWLRETLQMANVQEITEKVVRHYMVDLQERGKYTFFATEQGKEKTYPMRRRDYRSAITNTTINNYLRNLKVFFNWLEEEKIAINNPMRKVKQLPNQRKAKDFLSDEQFEKLCSTFDKSYFSEHRDLTAIVLMLDTGMRLGECLRLLLEDVDLTAHAINLREEETKTRKARTVFFSKKTETLLRKWLQYKDRYCESTYIFPVKQTGCAMTISGFETNFKHYVQRAKLPDSITPHALRNNFAKRCLMAGMNIYTLSRILGHSGVQVTEKAYLDLTDKDLKQGYQRFSPMENMKR